MGLNYPLFILRLIQLGFDCFRLMEQSDDASIHLARQEIHAMYFLLFRLFPYL
jgi:hypothetical protein